MTRQPVEAARKRGHVVLTLAPNEKAALDAVAQARGMTRSRCVAALAKEATATAPPRRAR